jgi:hypothetical protein
MFRDSAYFVAVALALLAGCSGATSGDPSEPAAGVDAATDAACTPLVDDAGVTHGCGQGGVGSGDHDDGGGQTVPPPTDASPDASDLPFGAPCQSDAQCASGVCFDYTVRGTLCTKKCSTNGDCPSPSPGCNGQGVCRMPGNG